MPESQALAAAAEQARRLSVLHSLLASEAEHPILVRLILSEAVTALGMQFGTIGFVRGLELIAIGSITRSAAIPISEPTPVYMTLAGSMLAQRRALLVEDLPNHPTLSSHYQVAQLGVGSYAGLPLTLDGTDYFISVASEEVRPPFTRDDLLHLETLGGILAGSLRRELDRDQIFRLQHYDRHTALPLQGLMERHGAGIMQDQPAGAFAVFAIDIDIGRILEQYDYEISADLVRESARRLDGIGTLGSRAYRGLACDFFLLATGVSDAADADALTREIDRAFAIPFEAGVHEVIAHAHTAVAMHPADGTTMQALAKKAIAGVKSAKAAGVSNNRATSAVRLRGDNRRRLTTELANAAERNELVLHYQPFIDLTSGELRGAEALVRWMNPEHGLIFPGEFIPLSENTEAISTIGLWVMRESARVAHQLAQAGRPLTIAFNVASRQLLSASFLDRLDYVLDQTGVDPALLEIEITESAAVEDTAAARHVLTECRSRGLKVALDDFGTGYSSLVYLRELPADVVKIDRSFVSRLPEDPTSKAISSAIIGLSHMLGRQVQAEGVETEAQLAWMRAEGCDLAQGFLLGRPAKVEDFLKQAMDQAKESSISYG